MRHSSGKMRVSFRPMLKKSPFRGNFKTIVNHKVVPENEEYSYYHPDKDNAMVIDLKIYDDQYEDEHHVLTSLTLNWKYTRDAANVSRFCIYFILSTFFFGG